MLAKHILCRITNTVLVFIFNPEYYQLKLILSQCMNWTASVLYITVFLDRSYANHILYVYTIDAQLMLPGWVTGMSE